MSEPGPPWLYTLFGATLASDRPLDHWLSPCPSPADLALRWPDGPSPWLSTAPAEPLFQSAEGAVSLHAVDGGDLLRFAGVGDFLLRGDEITAWVSEGERPAGEIRLLGPVLAFWLERRGVVALHASAVATAAGAVGFLGAHGAGKTSAAVAFLERGLPLLTDDILPLEMTARGWFARPGYPQLRARADLLRATLAAHAHAPLFPGSEKSRVATGDAFHAQPLPLARLYVLDRGLDGKGVEIAALARHAAVVELVRHSFSPRLVAAAGLQPARLGKLAELVQRVPVQRLSYRSGYDALSRLADAVLADLATNHAI